jgi:hypothetical protein
MTQQIKEYRTLYPSAARTATPTPVAFDDGTNARQGAHIVINVTAIGAAPSVVFNIEAFAPVANAWYPLLTSAAVTATTAVPLRLTVNPFITNAANVAASDILPAQWRVRPVHGNTDSITYSVEAIMR